MFIEVKLLDLPNFYKIKDRTNMNRRQLLPLSALFLCGVMNAQMDSLNVKQKDIDELVITGTMKEVSKSQSPVPVEIYTPKFFQKNPTPNLIEAVAMINGVRPQIHCSVCGTSDIKINGLDGPYTMVLIDGMPIVSSLSTVYGLSGIPNALIDRIEVVKGPASSLYGSEAMGGMINIITKNVLSAPKFTADVYGTTWAELNADVGAKFNLGKKVSSLLSVNHFLYNNRVDYNNDNFMDITLQKRTSVFNKWNFQRKEGRQASVALRYMYEDRAGGEMQWNHSYRGTDEVYGESIYTNRFEAIGAYQLPLKEKIFTQFSYNYHFQDSFYGDRVYKAKQSVAFGQAYWNPIFGNHDLLIGSGFRYTYYDDNSVGTLSADGKVNQPQNIYLPGVFIQDQWKLGERNTLLLGYRFDYDKNHKGIHSPRVAWKTHLGEHHIRTSFGTGFRVVNLFTEDHSALTGSRQVVIEEELKPEKSINFNVNHVYKWLLGNGYLNFDTSIFYSHFSNKIVGDFETDSDKILYKNLNGYAENRGISTNIDWSLGKRFKMSLGATYMDVFRVQDGERIRQLHAPKWSGVYSVSYAITDDFMVDLTGQIYGPMRLSVVENDFRPEYSPWYSIANIKASKKIAKNLEIYGGIKNILNFKPKNPILRPFDPFDKSKDDVVNNPNGYTFDTTYGYASLQGIRGFLGLSYTIK